MAQARKRKNGHDLDAKLQALRSDFETLQGNMRKLVESVGDVAGAGVTDVANGAANVASETAGQVEHWAEEQADGVRGAIRQQPFTAIALSMGAGAIIGTLLRR